MSPINLFFRKATVKAENAPIKIDPTKINVNWHMASKTYA
jgi:hypothetical protein